MRKTVLLLSIILLTSTSLAYTSQSSAPETELPEVGATPGSMTYKLERAQESLSLALTFDEKRKTEKKLRFARKRLAEAKELGERNDSEKSVRAMEEYRKNIEEVEDSMEKLPQEERDRMREDLDRTRSSAETVLTGLQERLPEQAMKGLEAAPENKEAEKVGNRPEGTGKDESAPVRKGFVATGKVVADTS